MSAFHDRDKIHAQLLRNAGRLWGWGENIPDEYTLDPVIRIMLGAVAGESQRVGQEIEASRARVMERLAEVLTPESLTLPLPAHAVATASPAEPLGSVSENDVFQFAYQGQEMVFTPAGTFALSGVQLRFTAIGGKVFQHGNGRRELLFENSGGTRMPEHTLWIGLSCSDGLDSLNGLHLFFDWKNQPGKSALLPLLGLVRWQTGRYAALETATGWSGAGTSNQPLPTDFFNPAARIQQEVCRFYAPQVIHLQGAAGGAEEIVPERRLYPPRFEEWFLEDDLRRMREPVVWLEASFPQAFPADVLARTEIGVNPFPVLNHRLTTVLRQVPPELPVVPLDLPAREAFTCLESVKTAAGKPVAAGPFDRREPGDDLQVAVRSAGAARLDARAAPALLEHTLDVIRDEYQAFAAFDRDQLGHALDSLRQQVNNLEDRIRPLRTAGEGAPCLAFRGLTSAESIRIAFWSTCGHLGNGVPAGTRLEAAPRNGPALPAWLLTATLGGRARPVPSERLEMYRQAVLSRGRLVSCEDFRAFTRGFLPRHLWSEVSVRTAHRIGSGPRQGLLRCLEVQIAPPAGQHPTREEWRSWIHQLENALNERSAGLLPVFVAVNGISV